MITLMEVFNPRVAASPLPFVDGTEESDPIQIKNIDGLGPVNATINTAQYGSVDGEFYNGSIIGKRNIVITVGLNPDWSSQSIELLRSYLYQYFMPKSQVTLRFTSTHMPTVQIDGYVETCEPNIFAKDPEYQISVVCPQSDFVGVDTYSMLGVTRDTLDTTFDEFDYPGTRPTGFTLTISANATVTTSTGSFRVVMQNPDTTLFLVDPMTVNSDHNLILSSVQGDKYIWDYVISTGLHTTKTAQVDEISVWPQFQQGRNKFQILADVEGQDWLITYQAKYGGL